MWNVPAISALSGLATPFGAALVLTFRTWSKAALAFMLALASGVMLAVVMTQLMPTSVRAGSWWWFALGSSVGLSLMFWIDDLRAVHPAEPVDPPSDQARLRVTGQAIAVALAIHNLPEGMAIGAGGAIHARLAVIIATAMALHNLPQGMSVAAPLASGGMPRRKILALTVLISAVIPLGSLIPLLVGHMSPGVNAFMLALASGVMLYVVFRHTMPEAWRCQKFFSSLGGLLTGILLMLALAGAHVH